MSRYKKVQLISFFHLKDVHHKSATYNRCSTKFLISMAGGEVSKFNTFSSSPTMGIEILTFLAVRTLNQKSIQNPSNLSCF